MYEELYKAWKSEKSSDKLQPLPHDFYQRATKYLADMKDETSNSHTLQDSLIAKEKEITTRLLDELRQARRVKIFQAVQAKIAINPLDLTEEESKLIGSVVEPSSATEKRASSHATSNSDLVVLRFLRDIPEIAGVDLRIYGPFKKEDVASVPATNAEALVNQGTARVIEFKKAN